MPRKGRRGRGLGAKEGRGRDRGERKLLVYRVEQLSAEYGPCHALSLAQR